ncbi:MAG: alpha/beta fold hydrolase BchO [Oceanicaulis sp.]
MSALRLPAVWPHRCASDIVAAGGVSWHVQRFGAGPPLLLIHGTGASTHSFRALAGLLSHEFEIVMADLPGHGFSGRLESPGLPQVSAALGALMRHLGIEPAIAAGHSAGAAVALRMALDGLIAPRAVIGLCPALQPYGGAADGLASKLVRVALLNPVTPRLFAMRADERRVARLIARTGSNLDAEGVGCYARLFKEPEHIAGTLRLMANWRLRPLLDDLPCLAPPAVLIAAERDRATPPGHVETGARRIPACELVRLSGLGHLAHEEDPEAAAAVIRRVARGAGLLANHQERGLQLAGGGA